MSTDARSAAETVRSSPERPEPGAPRSYDFPTVTGGRLPNGLSVLIADLPGRPLVSASMVVTGGAVEEPPEVAVATVLAARALTEGTERYDAIALSRRRAPRRLAPCRGRLGRADRGVDVPRDRLAAPRARSPRSSPSDVPGREVERLRDERLNDLLQARADPRRRADEAFVETIYRPAARTTGRPADARDGRRARTRPSSARLRARPRSGRATLVVGGELAGSTSPARRAPVRRGRRPARAARRDRRHAARRRRRSASSIRPGSVQTEIRIGHRGLPRRIPDFHAVSVMGAILGGLFNSRLNMKLREEKGYTYGAGAGFDLRRGPGPSRARPRSTRRSRSRRSSTSLAELDRMRDERVTDAELRAPRDFLVGVFPLRFETAGRRRRRAGGLVVHDLASRARRLPHRDRGGRARRRRSAAATPAARRGRDRGRRRRATSSARRSRPPGSDRDRRAR
jgi:predicted Zn-dependent peptidase